MASGDTNITICNQALKFYLVQKLFHFSDTTNDASTVCNQYL